MNVKEIIEAIKTMHCDTSIDVQTAADRLEEIMGECEMMLDALKEENPEVFQ